MMTIRAHIRVESTLGRVTQVVEALATLPGVKKAHAVTGVYQVIGLVEAATASGPSGSGGRGKRA